MTPIQAQKLYDAREQTGAISGDELHDLFRAVCDGDPSPAGRTRIMRVRLDQYARSLRARCRAHKASGGVGGQYLLDIAAFASTFGE